MKHHLLIILLLLLLCLPVIAQDETPTLEASPTQEIIVATLAPVDELPVDDIPAIPSVNPDLQAILVSLVLILITAGLFRLAMEVISRLDQNVPTESLKLYLDGIKEHSDSFLKTLDERAKQTPTLADDLAVTIATLIKDMIIGSATSVADVGDDTHDLTLPLK